MKRRSLKIVKIDAQKSPQYKQEFVTQPINYLKIIENKDKIKYEYLNKDFDPKHDLKQLSGRRLEYPNPNPPNEDISDPTTTMTTSTTTTSTAPTIDYTTPHHQPQPMLKSDLSKYTFDIPADSDDEDYHPKKRVLTPPRPNNHDEVFVPPSSSYTPPRPQIITHTETYSPQRTPISTPKERTPERTPERLERYNNNNNSYNDEDSSSNKHVYNYDLHTPPREDEDNQYSKLRDFLNGSDNDESDDDYYARRRKHHKVVDPYKYMSEEHKKFNLLNTGPPTLDELEKRGEYSTRQEYLDLYKMDEMLKSGGGGGGGGDEDDDKRSRHSGYSIRSIHSKRSTPSRFESHHSQPTTTTAPAAPTAPPHLPVDDLESIDDKKRELLGKLDMLRKKYPEHSHNIPFMTMHSSVKELEFLYLSELRKLEIDNNVNDYRTYLIGFFMITEFVLGKFLRLDLQGFTQQQMVNMKRYERFLIEIGEKNYIPEGKKLPVEVRLLGFVLIQAGVFVASKMILKKTGTNLMGMFNSTVNSFEQQQQHANGNRRKMKMPDIDLDDD